MPYISYVNVEKKYQNNLTLLYVYCIFVSYSYIIQIMNKHNKKYIQIIKTAKTLFWKHGIKRVTIEEICATADVSKMTFYKFFTNKNILVRHILDRIFDESVSKYNSIMASDKNYKDKVSDLVVLKMESTKEISHEFLSDFYNLEDAGLKTYMQQKTEESLTIMMNDILIAQKNGDIRADIKPEFIMYFLNHLTAMSDDPSLRALYPDAQDMILELMNFYFYGILPRKES